MEAVEHRLAPLLGGLELRQQGRRRLACLEGLPCGRQVGLHRGQECRITQAIPLIALRREIDELAVENGELPRCVGQVRHQALLARHRCCQGTTGLRADRCR